MTQAPDPLVVRQHERLNCRVPAGLRVFLSDCATVEAALAALEAGSLAEASAATACTHHGGGHHGHGHHLHVEPAEGHGGDPGPARP